MRISWLEPGVIRRVREALIAHCPDWNAHFGPDFLAPPAPEGLSAADWPRMAEHVARAERVGAVVRDSGLAGAASAFGASDYAIEIAILIAAAAQSESLDLDLLESLCACEVDDMIAYGTFFSLLVDTGASAYPDRTVSLYERLCASVCDVESAEPTWGDRVGAAQDGLACLYVSCGRFDDGNELFTARHAEERGDLVVALAASRAFLSAGAVGYAVRWLDRGAERAVSLGRPGMETRLRKKQEVLRKRLS